MQGQDSKRLRSTSNFPRSAAPVSDSGGARAALELDHEWGLVRPPSGEDTDSERENSGGELSPNIRNPFGNLSGADNGSRQFGNASLAEVQNALKLFGKISPP